MLVLRTRHRGGAADHGARGVDGGGKGVGSTERAQGDGCAVLIDEGVRRSSE